MSMVTIIAEVGVNHNGDINTAKCLIDEAKKAGADIVKFQTAILDSLVTSKAGMAEYQKKAFVSFNSQKEMLKSVLLPFDDFISLKNYCDAVGVEFLSTPFDIESVLFLNDMVNIWKIPSGEITNYPYLIRIAETHKPVILSTGMSTMDEVKAAVSLLRDNGSGNISLLHCNTQYPTPYEDVNLRAMQTMRDETGLEVGYSDHTLGIEVPIAAVAMGATIIEKHFTLDRNMEGPDHKASLEPDELKAMVDAIRNIEKSIGDGSKCVTDSERGNIEIVRKSIVAKTDIKKGDVLSEDNITTKRPGSGISPMRWNEVLGTRAVRDFYADELIEM